MTVRHTAGARASLAVRNSSLVSNLAQVARSAWHWLEYHYDLIQYRRGLESMLELDDHLLRDMGLTRYDVRRAIQLPIHESGGKALARVRRLRNLHG